MNPFYGMAFSLSGYTFNFTVTAEHLIVTAKEPDPVTGVHPSYVYSVSDGLVLQYDEATKTLSVLASPPSDYSYFEAFLSLHGPYASVGINLARLVLHAGGFGAVDIIDTDPLASSYRELPLYDFKILATEAYHVVKGVEIQRKEVTGMVTSFADGTTYAATYVGHQQNEGLLFRVYYA